MDKSLCCRLNHLSDSHFLRNFAGNFYLRTHVGNNPSY